MLRQLEQLSDDEQHRVELPGRRHAEQENCHRPRAEHAHRRSPAPGSFDEDGSAVSHRTGDLARSTQCPERLIGAAASRGDCPDRGRRSCVYEGSAGNKIAKRDPAPGSLSNSICPPLCFTIP